MPQVSAVTPAGLVTLSQLLSTGVWGFSNEQTSRLCQGDEAGSTLLSRCCMC